jgi:hypothetical protein
MDFWYLEFHGKTLPAGKNKTLPIGSFVIYYLDGFLPTRYGSVVPNGEFPIAEESLVGGYLGLISGLQALVEDRHTTKVSISTESVELKPILQQLTGEVDVPADLLPYYEEATQLLQQFREVDYSLNLATMGLAERVIWETVRTSWDVITEAA